MRTRALGSSLGNVAKSDESENTCLVGLKHSNLKGGSVEGSTEEENVVVMLVVLGGWSQSMARRFNTSLINGT